MLDLALYTVQYQNVFTVLIIFPSYNCALEGGRLRENPFFYIYVSFCENLHEFQGRKNFRACVKNTDPSCDP